MQIFSKKPDVQFIVHQADFFTYHAKSWAVKTTRESAEKLEVTVHSKNRYQLAHLLEFGHAKRGGGRTKAQPHIAPAEENGINALEKTIEKPVAMGVLSEEELNAELEKGYADMLTGRVRPADQVFADIRRDHGI